ncbi:DUF2848 domain-containing protein [Polynucleobacter sinensis]|uniref:DUF2848 domain-containing protein n=1 Tax=Polynucleobacter sinensis TaxID=1743157 RepID=UPI00078184EB|nr:DUF2848 domain-containing protein [Polynucleobacter sinensis]
MVNLNLSVDGVDRVVNIKNVVIAGWTGRNIEAVEHHIQELAELGVARPRTVPCFYRVSESLLSTSADFQVVGNDSSGEVEYVIFSLPDGLYIGLGSDHTDRKVEAYGVTVSKQMCPKPVASHLWKLSDIEGHWDSLITRSWVVRQGNKSLYQEGAVSRMLSPQDLISKYTDGGQLDFGTVMFCGTHSVLGEIRGGDIFEIEIYDPILNRSIKHEYKTTNLEIVD